MTHVPSVNEIFLILDMTAIHNLLLGDFLNFLWNANDIDKKIVGLVILPISILRKRL